MNATQYVTRLGRALGRAIASGYDKYDKSVRSHPRYLLKNAVLNGPARIRTLDQWIMSPLLYR